MRGMIAMAKHSFALNDGIQINFNITTLDMIASFIHKDGVLRTRKVLSNINLLFQKIDTSVYEKNPDTDSRVWFIKKSLDAKLNGGFDNSEYIKQYCYDDIECDEFRKKFVENFKPKISYDESKWLINKINDILEFGYTMQIKDQLLDVLNRIDSGDFRTYKQVQDDLHKIAIKVIAIKRGTSSTISGKEFSLEDDIIDQALEDTLSVLNDRNRIFQTGIKRWNTILGPGYLGKKLYVYLAFPGGGKSTILLKSALDIKRYNHGIKTRDPDKRPAVLLLTLENDIPETVERIYNMSVDSDDIRNYTAKQIKKKLREDGDLKLTEKNNINIIIKEYKNREIDTDDLYSIINDYDDDGIEIVALIVDYVKRIRPAEKGSSEKEELKNITNELKEVAKFYNIPVITAQQLNRAGAAVVDAALQAKKEDITRLVGRDAVAGAWEIIENADFVAIINHETKSDTGELYLTFKMLKRRYKSTAPTEALRRFDYFNHPFEKENEIRLIDDFDLPKSLSLTSLSTQFEPANQQKRESNIQKKSDKKNKSIRIDDDYDIFDEDQSIIQF